MGTYDNSLFKCGFAFGSVEYTGRYPGDKNNDRIVLNVTIAGKHTTPMIVDTGGPWCVLHPETAEELGLIAASYEVLRGLNIRGIVSNGYLVKVPIAIQPTNGNQLTLDTTFFIPALLPGETWIYPNFLGLDGFLNLIRFAVDAQENTFYFGHSQ